MSLGTAFSASFRTVRKFLFFNSRPAKGKLQFSMRAEMQYAACTLRRATLNDMAAVASIHRLAFFDAMPHIPVLHTPEETLTYYSKVLFPKVEIWLGERAGAIGGFIAFRPGWVEQLYVHPEHQSRGIGSLLIGLAKKSGPELRLWTFQCNERACRFYERHGFRIERQTDGGTNEERQPDFLYLWNAPLDP